jgi:hypothetical protein
MSFKKNIKNILLSAVLFSSIPLLPTVEDSSDPQIQENTEQKVKDTDQTINIKNQIKRLKSEWHIKDSDLLPNEKHDYWIEEILTSYQIDLKHSRYPAKTQAIYLGKCYDMFDRSQSMACLIKCLQGLL